MAGPRPITATGESSQVTHHMHGYRVRHVRALQRPAPGHTDVSPLCPHTRDHRSSARHPCLGFPGDVQRQNAQHREGRRGPLRSRRTLPGRRRHRLDPQHRRPRRPRPAHLPARRPWHQDPRPHHRLAAHQTAQEIEPTTAWTMWPGDLHCDHQPTEHQKGRSRQKRKRPTTCGQASRDDRTRTCGTPLWRRSAPVGEPGRGAAVDVRFGGRCAGRRSRRGRCGRRGVLEGP